MPSTSNIENIPDEVLFEWEQESKKSYDFSDRELLEVYPEAGPTITANINRLKKEIIEERRGQLPVYKRALEQLKNSPVGLVLARFAFWESPVLDQTKRLKELEALDRLYTPRPATSGSVTDTMIARAKERRIEEFMAHPLPRYKFVRCPFHNERTASCKITGNTFHCFGCGEHGDVIDWLMKTEHRAFIEVIKSLQ